MSTLFSDGTRVNGTNRNEQLYRELRSARTISAANSRRRDHGRSLGRRAQTRPRVDADPDNAAATFGFRRLLDVLGKVMPMGSTQETK